MAAPTASELKTVIIGNLPSDFKPAGTQVPKTSDGITVALDDELTQICSAIASAWSTWQSAVRFGGVSVIGAGIGTWSGTGSGGAFNSTLSLTLASKYGTTDETTLVNSIKNRFQAAFNQWVSSYTFAGVTYSGSSTATSSSPGTFTATNVAKTLNLGTSTSMASLASNIRSDCGFDYGNSKSGDFIDALSNALKSKFDSWRSASNVTSNTVTGAAAAGTGNGSGTSGATGIVA